MGLGVQPQQEHFTIYTLIYVWKQYFQLLNWHKIVTYIIILTFFLKTANLIIYWLLSDATCHRFERTPSASPFDQIWRQGDKNHNFQTFQWIGGNLEMHSRLFTNRNFPSLLWIAKPQTNISKCQCWIYGWVGRTYVLNLSFTVENKMEN